MTRANPTPEPSGEPTTPIGGTGELTHFDAAGAARMVDIGAKPETARQAIARGRVVMCPETLRLIEGGGLQKGDVIGVARLAGIMGAKRTPDLIPLCHPLLLDGIEVQLTPDPERSALVIEAVIRTTGRTGAEMEALTAVSIAALTVYDMCKAVDKEMRIEAVRLVYKSGGKSGVLDFRDDAAHLPDAGAPPPTMATRADDADSSA